MSGSSYVSRRRPASIALAILTFLAIASVDTAARSQNVVIFEDSFERGSGAPTSFARTFSVSSPVEGPFTLTIDNGEPDPRRAGARMNTARGTVRLNGALIAGPGDFANQPGLTRNVTLEASNFLEVTLVGAPHGHFTLRITGIVNVAILAIAPDNGPVDTPVTITGSGLDAVAANNQVSFNGTAAVVVAATATTIQTIVPEGATTGPITVTTPHGSASSAPFTVTSGNRLLISKSPDQQIYSRGQPITIDALVVDRNGAPVPNAVVTLASDPAEDSRTGNTFVYQADGTFTITATADPIAGEPPLTASLIVTVDGQGPAIACLQPIDGGMVNAAPGSSLLFQGTVNSSRGISAFTVNGVDTPVVEGSFSTSIATAFGLNVVDLSVVDSAGLTAHKICSFVLSATWASESQLTANTVTLKAVQSAIDDNSRAGALNSFDDLLHAVINSSDLRDTLHNALSAANPLKPDSCDEQVSTPFGNFCVLSSEVRYQSSQLAGPNTVSLTLVNGGMASRTRFEDPVVRLRVLGEVAGVPYDTTGDVLFDFVEIDTTFDTSLSSGRPNISIRANSIAVRVGSIAASFPGLDSSVLEQVIVPLANGVVRNAVANVLRNYTTNNFNAVLDGVISSLDVTLPASFAVSRLSQASQLTMNFGVGFSSLNTNTSRVLFGIGTRFLTASSHARPSLGAPIEAGAVLLDPSVNAPSSIGEAYHEVIRGQALHALWRGGYFDEVLTAGALNGVVPDEVSATTVANLPPVTRLRDDGRVEVAIGALSVQLHDAALFPGALDTSVAARVSCATQLADEVLLLNDCTVDDLAFSAAQPLGASASAQADAFLRQLLGAMLVTAARDTLPALPVPVFTLPASLDQFGLPGGAMMGTTGAFLNNAINHHVRRGYFGVR